MGGLSMASGGRVSKAVIPVAGLGTRLFPATAAVPKALLALTDVDGVARALLHILLRTARQGGIERFGLVVSPGQEEPLRQYFRPHALALSGAWGEDAAREAREIEALAERITYIGQPTAEGFGHAVWCGRGFVDGEPFVLLLGDQLLVSRGEGAPDGPIGRLLAAWVATGGVSVTAVEPRPASELRHHGTLAGEPLAAPAVEGVRLWRVRDIVEKPDPQLARRRLRSAGLDEDTYLTHAGAYVFGPEVVGCLDELVRGDVRERGEIQLTAAQARLASGREDYFAAQLVGYATCDAGNPAGLADTQAVLADCRALAGRGEPARPGSASPSARLA